MKTTYLNKKRNLDAPNWPYHPMDFWGKRPFKNYYLQKKNLFFVLAAFLFILWAIVFFCYKPESYVHILLVLAGFALLIRLFNNRKIA
jgi:hypothetical protein